MNKKTTLLSGAIFSLALLLSGCNNSAKNTVTGSVDSLGQFSSSLQYNGSIAFIRMDTLMSGYGMFIDMSDDFGKKQQKAESDLQARGRSLEREAMEYQEKVQKGLLTRFQATSMEEGLQKKQQEIMSYRDRVMGELAQKEQVMTSQIMESITTYVKEYNQDKKFSMILTTSGGQPVLVADPQMDITTDILNELNKRYLESKDKEAKKAK